MAGPNTLGSIRRRTRKACEPCRRRKRKCDGGKPCRLCQEYEYTCSYEEDRSVEPTAPDAGPSGQNVPNPLVRHAEDGAECEMHEFFEPKKKRFYNAGSAISFPRALALSLKVGVPPRIHSFAYNVGVATEHFLQVPDQRLSNIMSLQEARAYSVRYFETVNNLFAVVDAESFDQSLTELWSNGRGVQLEFETLACFVILLGALFSYPARCEKYQILAEYAQNLLDQSCFHDAPSLLHYENLQAWILRTVLVRCTTRPNITWVSSSITMHLAESLGLHREYCTLEKLELNVPSLSKEQINMRRKLFWIAWTLNRMISFEVGRSATFISSINSKLPAQDEGVASIALIKAYELIYPDGTHLAHEQPESCLVTIAKTTEMEGYQGLLVALVHADIACGLYRVIHKSNSNIRQSVGENVITIVKRGLEAVRQLTELSQPWWSLTSMPFQFVCVAVAVGRPYILDVVPEAMSVLEHVNERFDTKMTQEACQTARLLLQTALQTRNKELAAINKALSENQGRVDEPHLVLAEEDWGINLAGAV